MNSDHRTRDSEKCLLIHFPPTLVHHTTLLPSKYSFSVYCRYRVNGASIWARGSNVIPLDEFAGRADAAAHEIHLESAAAAGMNVLLIWGGGIFMYEAFYARADELGLLLYQVSDADCMYVQFTFTRLSRNNSVLLVRGLAEV